MEGDLAIAGRISASVHCGPVDGHPASRLDLAIDSVQRQFGDRRRDTGGGGDPGGGDGRGREAGRHLRARGRHRGGAGPSAGEEPGLNPGGVDLHLAGGGGERRPCGVEAVGRGGLEGRQEPRRHIRLGREARGHGAGEAQRVHRLPRGRERQVINDRSQGLREARKAGRPATWSARRSLRHESAPRAGA